MDLKGNTAVVTGGGRGIGRAVTLALAREGCNVVVASRSAKEIAAVAREIDALGTGAACLGLSLDIAEESSVERLVGETIARFGCVGVLVNNAGMLITNRVPDVSADEWDRTMAVNLRAAFLLSQRVLVHMKGRGCGYIINVSSPAARSVGSSLVTYGVSKAGIIALSQALFDEAKAHGIKVSTLFPGYVDTEMIWHRPDLVAQRARWAQPEDMAECILFLLKLSDRVIVKELTALAFGTE
jgi:3-oxoacyl-[acyl-carrier protein] reductase